MSDNQGDWCGPIVIILIVFAAVGMLAWFDYRDEVRGTNYAELLMVQGDATIEIEKSTLIKIPAGYLDRITVTGVEDGRMSLTGPSHSTAFIYKHYLR